MRETVLLLFLATATPLVAHDPGLSSSVWQVRRNQVSAKFTFAPADADWLDLAASVPLAVEADGVSVAPTAQLLDVGDPENVTLYATYPLRASTSLNPTLRLAFVAAPMLPWGHRHHSRILDQRGVLLAEHLLSATHESAVVRLPRLQRARPLFARHEPVAASQPQPQLELAVRKPKSSLVESRTATRRTALAATVAGSFLLVAVAVSRWWRRRR
ncbi:MAG: hypothetical protein AAF581_20740 [Planctomycetota bacterium]